MQRNIGRGDAYPVRRCFGGDLCARFRFRAWSFEAVTPLGGFNRPGLSAAYQSWIAFSEQTL